MLHRRFVWLRIPLLVLQVRIRCVRVLSRGASPRAFILFPCSFAIRPSFLKGRSWRVVETAIATLLGLLAFAAASEGFHMVSLGVLYRVLFLVVAVLMLWPLLVCHAVGMAILLVLILLQRHARATHPN